MLPRRSRTRGDPVELGQIGWRNSLQASQRMAPSGDDDVWIVKQLLLPKIARPKRRSECPPKEVKPRGSQIIQKSVVVPINNLHECIWMYAEQFLDRGRQNLRIRVRDVTNCNPRNDIALCGLHFLDAIVDLAKSELDSSCELGPPRVCGHAFRCSVIQTTAQLAFKIPGGSMERGLRNRKEPGCRIE